MTDINVINSSNSSRRTFGQKFISISKFIWLPLGFIIFIIAATVESQIIPDLIDSTVNAFWNAPEYFGELIGKIAETNSDISYIILNTIGVLITVAWLYIAALLWVVLSIFIHTVKWFPVILAVFSLLHVLQCFVENKPLKKKWAAVFLRVLLLIFAIASIVFVVLFVTGTIPLYDFLRSWVLFFIGSIVLNVFLE